MAQFFAAIPVCACSSSGFKAAKDVEEDATVNINQSSTPSATCAVPARVNTCKEQNRHCATVPAEHVINKYDLHHGALH